MREEYDKGLCEKYPEIFADRYADMQSTAMCWGFECDDGWYTIIDELCAGIMEVCNRLDEEVPRAMQVKEKWGTLRFYLSGYHEEIDRLVTKAEKQTSKVCETCGKPGILYTVGWNHVACEEHRNINDDSM